jgi:hypothetical protein
MFCVFIYLSVVMLTTHPAGVPVGFGVLVGNVLVLLGSGVTVGGFTVSVGSFVAVGGATVAVGPG